MKTYIFKSAVEELTNAKVRERLEERLEFISRQKTDTMRGMEEVQVDFRVVAINVRRVEYLYLVEIGVHDWTNEEKPRLVGHKVYSEQYKSP